MTELESLKLFLSTEHACSYLENKNASTLFIDPKADISQTGYSQLSDYGFRRSGKHIYKPECQDCNACIAVRVPVAEFHPSKSQKRCLKKNADLTLKQVETIDTDEHFALYADYINPRHSDGDMYPPNRKEYAQFLSRQFQSTTYLEWRDTNNTLVAIAVTDRLQQGLSAIYTFFDPHQPKRSLGVFGILMQIQLAQQNDLEFVYLGYWIQKCVKMNYKTQYLPYQLYINHQWHTYER